MTKNVIFLGPPGCGKGTQADLLVRELGYIQVSTGNLLREIAKQESDLGKKIQSILTKGILVSDDLVNQLIDKFYNENGSVSGVILDGYPRSVSQAESLEGILNKHDFAVGAVFYFDLPEDVLLKRILGRYTCSECGAIYNSFFSNTTTAGECDKCHSVHFNRRTDDSKEVIEKRLKVYRESTAPLLEYYKNKLIKIDAEQSVSLVSKLIVDYLK